MRTRAAGHLTGRFRFHAHAIGPERKTPGGGGQSPIAQGSMQEPDEPEMGFVGPAQIVLRPIPVPSRPSNRHNLSAAFSWQFRRDRAI